jgi:RimJ/RimL family protein N-acetyltransferase
VIVAAQRSDFAALLAGEPVAGAETVSAFAPPEVLAMLADLAATISSAFTPAAWLIIEQGCVVGLCSLVKPPAEGAITLGYGIAEEFRRQGMATRAVGDVVAWAGQDPRVRTVLAETAIDNPASQRVLEGNGFVKTGTRHDAEDGDLFCWKRDVS